MLLQAIFALSSLMSALEKEDEELVQLGLQKHVALFQLHGFHGMT
jgi:hypothetical protein